MSRLSGADQEWLLSEMAHAVRTGQPLPETLNELAKANPGTRRGGVAHRISGALSSGLTLNQAVDNEKCFPLGVPEAIASGERGGRLDAVLESLARNVGLDTSLRQSILHAVGYPLIVGIAAFASVLFIQFHLVPQFGQMFAELDVSLPILTELVLSGAVAGAFAALMGFAILLLLLYVLPQPGWPLRALFDRLRVTVPVVGHAQRRFFLARWCATMSVLVNAGVPEAQAVRLAGRSTGHAGFEAQSEWIAKEVEKGRPLAEAMGAKSFFPPMLAWMVGASQKAGGHAAVWPAAQDLYRAQGERLSHVTSVVLRVVFILLMVLIVGLTVYALFLPLLKLMNSLGGGAYYGRREEPVINGLALLWVLFVILVAYSAGRLVFGNWFRKVRRNLLSAFLMEYLGALAKLRLPLTQGIESCSRMLSRGSRRDLSDVERNLAEGVLIGDALANVPRWKKTFRDRLNRFVQSCQPFPPPRLISAAEAEALRVGEMSGDLGGAFDLVLKERRCYEGIRTSLTAALLYPLAVLLVASGVLSGICVFIVPKFAQMFREMDVTLPQMTQMTVHGAGYMGDLWLWLLLLLLAARLVVPRLRRMRPLLRGREPLRERVVRLPQLVAYKIPPLRRAMLAEFCTELAMLVRVGAPAHRALVLLAEGTMNPWFRDRIRVAAELCEKGEHLSTALEKAGLDERAAWFGRAAGDAAELADSLSQLAEDYRARVSWVFAVGGRLLPPLLILGLGCVVGFIVISLFMPLVKLVHSLAGW